MLVLLPPSETKAAGDDGPQLAIDQLSFAELNPVRRKVAAALAELGADLPASAAALRLSARQSAEASRNARLWDAPTLPALRRYTGVLYDALGLERLSAAEKVRAQHRLAVASALFGVVAGTDQIPGYRLSADSKVPALGPLGKLWRPALEPVLGQAAELIVDLRSAPYAALAQVPGAIRVRVVTENTAGQRSTVSHHNKAAKGRLAAALAAPRSEPSTAAQVIKAARSANLRLEQTAEHELELLTP